MKPSKHRRGDTPATPSPHAGMTDEELRRIAMTPGIEGQRAFIALSERNIARRKFSLK